MKIKYKSHIYILNLLKLKRMHKLEIHDVKILETK